MRAQCLLTTGEVANYLRCTKSTIRRLPIPFIKRGRARLYDPSDIRAYVDKAKQHPVELARARIDFRHRSDAIGFMEARRLRLAAKT